SKKTAQGRSRENAFSRLPFASLCSVHVDTARHCPSFDARLRGDHELFRACACALGVAGQKGRRRLCSRISPARTEAFFLHDGTHDCLVETLRTLSAGTASASSWPLNRTAINSSLSSSVL